MSGVTSIRPEPGLRENAALRRRLARSAASLEGVSPGTDEVLDWLRRRRDEGCFSVERIPLDELDGWSFEASSGNLTHRSGRFFTVEGLDVGIDVGLDVGLDHSPSGAWRQPVICQPEIGILGILAKEFDGVLHFLMQAKMEPGNPNLVQLSPTVQATRSNYTTVHGGSRVRYIDHFTRPGRARVLSDALQSEHGSWFYRKRNRNMVVEVDSPVPLHEDFRWLTLGQIARLTHHDTVVNMDARSVLAGLPGAFAPRALSSDAEVLSWLADVRSQNRVRAQRVPLVEVPGWERDESAIAHEHGRYFRVVAVSVRAGSREVGQWTQPLFEPREEGVVAFLTRDIEGVPHVLASAREEGGLSDAELGPTVQCAPGNHAHLPDYRRPPFLDLVRDPDPSSVRYLARHSEEGGRFLNSVSRYLVIEADESQAPLTPPPGFRWVSHGQIAALTQHSRYVNVQARTLLTCLNAMSAGTGREGWGITR